MKKSTCTRRVALARASSAAVGLSVFPVLIRAAEPAKGNTGGAIAGEPTAAKVGGEILLAGGNAIDAAVAAALAAAVVSPNNCGVGGYGGHMTLALKGGKKIVSIDFNSAAPRAATADMFALDEKGAVRERGNEFGWRAAGVPGTLAGLQLALARYGTKSLAEVAAPAIQLARDGFPVSAGFAGGSRAMVARLRKDPGSAKLYLKNDAPYAVGEMFRNPELADLLDTLARRGSFDAFYRGAVARAIADAFGKNGGLLTFEDMSGYEAKEVEPLRLEWGEFSIFTAPLTAGGLTVLQALTNLKALSWPLQRIQTDADLHRRVEALRIAWRDRLTLLGDPKAAPVPVEKLLSREYANQNAELIERAAKDKKPLAIRTTSREHGGTIHLSSGDREGNLVALTLTHGNTFGACVTVEGLGLTLGHGMSRFEPRPGHPNSVGSAKRPLHNMCPTVVLRNGKPDLAVGGAGGRRIVNGVFDVLSRYLLGAKMEDAVAAPRMNTQGGLELEAERTWPESERSYLESVGFKLSTVAGARVTAVVFDQESGSSRAASR